MYRVKCTKAFAEFPFFHGECIDLTISQQQLQLILFILILLILSISLITEILLEEQL